ncbi:MAG: hypothetical protein GF409_04255 [Candidatus Omnitrophica bacterium]|nr:hypothetical protein [Candidatus Omnitrophota bacterium]
MWTKWLPWRLIIRILAKEHGFIDPFQLLSRLTTMAQPSEVLAPVELLRLAAVLHARGLINSQVIQNNLDWLWPYWVQKQFDPASRSFVPRAFSLTHINLTHRNWTAVGIPGVEQMPIVDPRGLVTPLYDGWSIDSWLVGEDGYRLVPSRALRVCQKLEMLENLSVMTDSVEGKNYLTQRVEVENEKGENICRIRLTGSTEKEAYLVVSLRPCNPEGISFIHEVSMIPSGWLVNKKNRIVFENTPDGRIFSEYARGDVFNDLFRWDQKQNITCNVGLCTAAALFKIEPGGERDITVSVPLGEEEDRSGKGVGIIQEKWKDTVSGVTRLEIPDEKIKYLYDASIRNLILLSPEKIYAGPFTYKQFWFRDAAYALNAMLSVNLKERARNIIDAFPKMQTPTGYFRSQDGEWDSNGQVLWSMKRYSELTGRAPEESWRRSIASAVRWIHRKRSSRKQDPKCSGLFPAGFSAEHFGPNDFYYWDDFWGVAGLEAGELMAGMTGNKALAEECRVEKGSFLKAINESISKTQKEEGISTVPASPFRRMDSSAVGTMVAGYPLKIYGPREKAILDTADFLIEKDFLNGLFFHEIAHSGVNIYLSLQIAQVLLRAGDTRFIGIMDAAGEIASDTGQWPEAIHPWTGGGCMGDGQHLWAAAEWVMMVRNCFITEEKDKLVLCSGIRDEWLAEGNRLFFGPAPTPFGDCSIEIACFGGKISVGLDADWRGKRPEVEVRLPGRPAVHMGEGSDTVQIEAGAE